MICRYMRDLVVSAVAGVATAIAVGWLLLSCSSRPLSTDAGADPAISQCCDWWIFPLLYDTPQTCLDNHTDEGECRWLSCLGGLVTYESCR